MPLFYMSHMPSLSVRTAVVAVIVPVLALLLAAGAASSASSNRASNVLPPLRGSAGLIADHGGMPLPASAAAMPGPAVGPRTVALQVVGQLPPHLFQGMAFGDSDHDGLTEVGMYINNGGNFTHRLYESPAGHTWGQVAEGPALIPYGIGDADGDGLAETMGQWSFWLYVYEATSPNGHPNHLAWQSPAMTNVVGFATFGDVDADGRIEILHTLNPFSGPSYLMIFENSGDDAFTLVHQAFLDDGNGGTKVIEDFDGDGRREIATSTLNGKILVFESTGDDSYALTWVGNLGTYNAYACALGHDMDGNGKPELVVGGSSDQTGYVTTIYEATGDNSFAPVQTITIVNGYHGLPFNATGDLDGDGRDELAIETAFDLYVYEPDAIGHYVEIAHVPQPVNIMNGLAIADADDDLLAEIYWQTESALSGPPTLIYESSEPAGLSDGAVPPADLTLAAAPNPFVARTRVWGGGAGEVRIHDLAGRLVTTLAGPEFWWDGRNAAGRRVAPGLYVLRASGGTAKVTVLPR